LYRIFERRDNGLLSDDIGKDLRPIAARHHSIGSRHKFLGLLS
jgi:hypothetical protein